MQFSDEWVTLRTRIEELPSHTAFLTPLSEKQFHVTDVSEMKMTIKYRKDDRTEQLQRKKFETLLDRVVESRDGFDLDRLPSNAEPYATVLSLHPHIRLDPRKGTMTQVETSTNSPLIDVDEETSESSERSNQGGAGKGVSLGEMLSKMSTPEDKVECPITSCDYTSRSAESVAAHVSSSSTDKHIWAHTPYAGWRDFVRKHE